VTRPKRDRDSQPSRPRPDRDVPFLQTLKNLTRRFIYETETFSRQSNFQTIENSNPLRRPIRIRPTHQYLPDAIWQFPTRSPAYFKNPAALKTTGTQLMIISSHLIAFKLTAYKTLKARFTPAGIKTSCSNCKNRLIAQ